MSDSPSSESPAGVRGRGRGRNNRGGLGKYLRARGRGRGRGRPAEFVNRLVLEEEQVEDLDEEEAAERAAKYARRHLGTNADRYVEPEPELGSDGEPIVEPEVDLSAFLEKQRITDAGPSIAPVDFTDHEDVDTSLAHIGSQSRAVGQTKKGKMEKIEWDEELENMSRDKASAEAAWDLKARFRAKSERLRAKPVLGRQQKTEGYTAAPALPLPDGSQPPQKNAKQEMEDFLDDLIS
ncbi:hypothetical protein C0993_011998 [Termitomyces sp. T159_Od127]|nr:hypothetical protein C0993_011998 [Termitomyces sp. T159_Od127]